MTPSPTKEEIEALADHDAVEAANYALLASLGATEDDSAPARRVARHMEIRALALRHLAASMNTETAKETLASGAQSLELQRRLLVLHNQLACYSDEGTPRDLAAFLVHQSDSALGILKMIQKLGTAPPQREDGEADRG